MRKCELTYQLAAWALIASAAGLCMIDPSLAIEGNTAAGPIGGTDIRSALVWSAGCMKFMTVKAIRSPASMMSI
jgi:hypothetical protein